MKADSRSLRLIIEAMVRVKAGESFKFMELRRHDWAGTPSEEGLIEASGSAGICLCSIPSLRSLMSKTSVPPELEVRFLPAKDALCAWRWLKKVGRGLIDGRQAMFA